MRNFALCCFAALILSSVANAAERIPAGRTQQKLDYVYPPAPAVGNLTTVYGQFSVTNTVTVSSIDNPSLSFSVADVPSNGTQLTFTFPTFLTQAVSLIGLATGQFPIPVVNGDCYRIAVSDDSGGYASKAVLVVVKETYIFNELKGKAFKAGDRMIVYYFAEGMPTGFLKLRKAGDTTALPIDIGYMISFVGIGSWEFFLPENIASGQYYLTLGDDGFYTMSETFTIAGEGPVSGIELTYTLSETGKLVPNVSPAIFGFKETQVVGKDGSIALRLKRIQKKN